MLNGSLLREMLISGANALDLQKAAINNLNVFPVPDGDTGINMAQTACSVRQLPDDLALDAMIKEAAALMLRSARGNSGAILSLFFRGLAKGLAEHEESNIVSFSSALLEGTKEAYGAVSSPTEGTILTVMRLVAEEANHAASRYNKRDDWTSFFGFIRDVADRTLQRTPELLPVLRQAKVVDAGGAGFVAMLYGMSAAIEGNPVAASAEETQGTVQSAVFTDFNTNDITFPYCTECLVEKLEEFHGEGKATALRTALAPLGDSLVFIEDEEIIKIHIHVNTPGDVLNEALHYGELSSIKIENMRHQHTKLATSGEPCIEDIMPSEPTQDAAMVSVCCGEGIAQVFFDVGCPVTVSGGQSMNASTEEMLAGIKRANAKVVFLFPNNKNMILVAEAAAAMAENCEVVVVPTTTIPQGLSAAIAFNPDLPTEENKAGMIKAFEETTSLSVTIAAKDCSMDGVTVTEGEYLALNGHSILSSAPTLTEALASFAPIVKDAGSILLFAGEDATEEQTELLTKTLEDFAPLADISTFVGGQPLYHYLISVE